MSEDELHRIGWNHPRLGRISEVACPMHEGEILAALRVLGIGSTGRQSEPHTVCLRCAHGGQRASRFLPTAAANQPF